MLMGDSAARALSNMGTVVVETSELRAGNNPPVRQSQWPQAPGRSRTAMCTQGRRAAKASDSEQL